MLSIIAAMAAAVAAPAATPITAGKLAGTLLSPAQEPKAVVLMLPGSGPTDRDGNNPMGVRANSYRLLAEALAERGIASVRIDKRGLLASAGATSDGNKVKIADYVADTQSWVAAIRDRTKADCVWLAGHSEGGLIALASAQQPGVCGVVLIATAGRPLGQLIRDQLKANPANAPILDQAFAALDSLEAGKRADVSAMHPALARGLFNPEVQDYLIDVMRQRPADLAAKVERPLLIVQGDNDLQVGVADAQALKAANSKAELVIVKGMNHVLKAAPEDRQGNEATMTNPDLPIEPGLVDAIVDFIESAK